MNIKLQHCMTIDRLQRRVILVFKNNNPLKDNIIINVNAQWYNNTHRYINKLTIIINLSFALFADVTLNFFSFFFSTIKRET